MRSGSSTPVDPKQRYHSINGRLKRAKRPMAIQPGDHQFTGRQLPTI
jgi:hypothetical protein